MEKVIVAQKDIEKALLLQTNHTLAKVSVLSEQEFCNKALGYYQDEAIYALLKKGYSFFEASTYFNEVQKLAEEDFDKIEDNVKMIQLKKVKQVIAPYYHLADLIYFEKKEVSLYTKAVTNDRLEKAIQKVKSITTVNLCEMEKKYSPNYHLISCGNPEEEVHLLVKNLSNDLRNKIPMNRIAIVVGDPSYHIYLKRYFHWYKLPYQGINNTSLWAYPFTKRFFDQVEKAVSPKETFESFFFQNEDILSFLKGIPTLSNLFYRVINSMMAYPLDEDALVLFKQKLQSMVVPHTGFENQFVFFNEITYVTNDFDKIYCVASLQDMLPKTSKDTSYFDDEEKEKIGQLLTREKNQRSTRFFETFLSSSKEVIFSYPRQTLSQGKPHTGNLSFTIQQLLLENAKKNHPEETNRLVDEKDTFEKMYLTKDYSKLASCLDYAIARDTFEEYHEITKNIYSLAATFSDFDEQKFKHAYDKVEVSWTKPLSVSYSAIEEFYRCPFRYYLNNVLRIDSTSTDFTDIGTLFHYCLEHLFKEKENETKSLEEVEQRIKELIAQYLQENNRVLSAKESYFFSSYVYWIRIIYLYNRELHLISTFEQKGLEQEISFEEKMDDFEYRINGKIDKFFEKEKDNQKQYVVMDYKTGTLHLEPEKYIYGLNLQLPFYFYLLKKMDPNGEIVGGFLERVVVNSYGIAERLSENLQDKFLLTGIYTADKTMLGGFDPGLEHIKVTKKLALTKEEFERLNQIVDEKIKNFIHEVKDNNYKIAPKRDSSSLDKTTCEYCKFKDICFVDNHDFTSVIYDKNLDFMKGDNENESSK